MKPRTTNGSSPTASFNVDGPLATALGAEAQIVNRGLRIHVGCGLTAPAGWENLDASPNARLARHPALRSLLARVGLLPRVLAQVPWPRTVRVWDVRAGFPFPDGSASCVYSSHFLEHLTPPEAVAFLAASLRVLEPGGCFRTVVPDLAEMLAAYAAARGRPDAADALLRATGAFEDPDGAERTWPLLWYHRLWGRHLHRWLYDEASLRLRLERAGFVRLARRGFGDSAIPGIVEVESRDRLAGALCLEAHKRGDPT